MAGAHRAQLHTPNPNTRVCYQPAANPCPRPKIRYRDDPAAVLSAAKKLGAGRARPALELVGFEGGVESAMKYVFGNTFVCQVRAPRGAEHYLGGGAAKNRGGWLGSAMKYVFGNTFAYHVRAL